MDIFHKGQMVLFIDEGRIVPNAWIEGVVVSYQCEPDEGGMEDYYLVKDFYGVEYFVTNDPWSIQSRSFGYYGDEVAPLQYDSIDFAQALLYLKQGHSVSRRGWNGKNMHLKLNSSSQSSDGDEISPFIMLYNAHGGLSVWNPSQDDLMAEDWHLCTRIANV